LGFLGIALQYDQDLALLAHRLLNGRHRRWASHGDRQDDFGEKHHTAHRQHDQYIRRERRRAVCRRAAYVAGRSHRAPLATLPRLITRQPLAVMLRTAPYRPGGNSTRRAKRPCGNSSRWMTAVRISAGSVRSPLMTRVPSSMTACTLAGSTPGKAAKISTASW